MNNDEHWLELQDRDGHALVRRTIQAFDHHAGMEHKDAGGFLFAAVLPWHDGTSRLALFDDGKEIASLDVPDDPPTCAPPAVQRTRQGLRVSWQADHARREQLLYLIRYATDEQRRWQFLAADLTEPVLEIPDGSISGSSTGFFQIGATGAGRTTWAESGPIEVPPSAPEVAIIAPGH